MPGALCSGPLGEGQQRVDIAIVKLGIPVTLFRHEAEGLSEDDQVVFNSVTFDATRAILPFGLLAKTITPEEARELLSHDVSGGRTVDFRRGDTRIGYFQPEDARVVGLTFNAPRVGITLCTVIRLGGEIPYPDIDRIFGRRRLGVDSRTS